MMRGAFFAMDGHKLMRANILDRRGFAMVAAALLALIFAPHSAFAQTPPAAKPVDIFVAEGVPVDVTAGSVTEARERGLTQGRVNGFRKVLERIVAQDDLARVPQPSANQIIEMVREFSIANERTSAVRYLAELTVRFDPNAVRNLLRRAGIPFTEIVSKPLAVVPVLRDDAGAAFLWNDPNPWRTAWVRGGVDRSLVPLFFPAGDTGDAEAITADQATAKDAQAIANLTARYDVGGALIAVAHWTPEGLQMNIAAARRGLPTTDFNLTYAGAPGQSRDEIMAGAVQLAARTIEEDWRRRNRITSTTTAQITALVPLNDLKEWTAVRTHLGDVPLVDGINLQAMTRDRAQVTLSYLGDQSQLTLAMAQQDLGLSQQGGVWVIELLRGGKGAGRTLGRPGPAAAAPASPK